MGNHGTPFPDLGSLCGGIFSIFFFPFLFILFLSRGNMPKLILMLCLFGTTVLAKPSGFQRRLDVFNVTCTLRQYKMDVDDKWQTNDWRCTDACKQYHGAACGNGVAYYCARTWIQGHPEIGTCRRSCRKDDGNYEFVPLVHDDKGYISSYVKCDPTLSKEDPQLHFQCVQAKKTRKPCKD